MHDPMTVAHEIRIFGHHLITIWHVDPETDGTDDSCRWAWPRLTKKETGYANYLIDCEYDNLRDWFNCSNDEAKSHIRQVFRLHKSLTRPWWKRPRYPRWHIWHWRLQVHPVQKLKRWMFSRCEQCGKRFKLGEAVVSFKWYSEGPRWFRSETDVYHESCSHKVWREEKEKCS